MTVAQRRARRCAVAAVAVVATVGPVASPPVATGATATAAIRVGGPSAPYAPKIAVVGSQRDLAGIAFKVLDANNHVVLTGTLQRAVGDPAPFRFAETANLSAIHALGTYRVVVGRSTSWGWAVRRHGTRPWVNTMLNLYRANADGREQSPYHAPSHLHDLHARVVNGPAKGREVNLLGGWMDAGDQVKSTGGIAYSVLLLAQAARVDPADRTAIRSVAAVGLRFLLRAHPAGGGVYRPGRRREHRSQHPRRAG